MRRKSCNRLINKKFEKKYKFKNIDYIPNKLENKTIYIVQEGNEPETLAFMCPCGCGEPVYLNLLRDTSIYWSFIIEKSRISIFPSVAKKKGCRSHYCISKGKVSWR